MERRNKVGGIITFLFSLSAFLLAIYAIFSPSSFTYHTNGAWLTAIFSLASVLLAGKMLKAGSNMVTAFNVLLIILAAITALVMGLHWILICLIVALIGCIVYKAGHLS